MWPISVNEARLRLQSTSTLGTFPRLARRPPQRQYVCLQARRVKNVSKAGLGNAVDRFLKGEWASDSQVFIYATSASTRSTSLVAEIEFLTDQLAEESIAFRVWSRDEISNRLRAHPELVDDFFGREWVRGVLRQRRCGRAWCPARCSGCCQVASRTGRPVPDCVRRR